MENKILNNAGVFVLLGLIVGFALGYVFQSNKIEIIKGTAAQINSLRLNDPNRKLISPLLASDIGEKKEFLEFKPFESKVIDLTNNLKSQGTIDDFGFYFRDLNTGRWVGLNENNKFYPASLMKVALLISYLKEAESDPTVLTKKLTYSQTNDLNQLEYTKPSQSIKPGESYTVNDLLLYMIAYSDNNATRLLSENINQNSFNEIYTDLGMPIPNSILIGQQDYLSAKEYTIFFRILYNATYLSKDLSEKALEILAKTDFKNGIRQGIPADTNFSHKFGEFSSQDPDGTFSQELHDCGIVYTSEPYLLCVMTKGKNRPQLESALSQISSLVYDEVKSNYK